MKDSANLDLLRSVAVLSVLMDHVLETVGWMHGFDPKPVAWYLGRLGVLMFFVHTCLVLLLSLERGAARGRDSSLGFYVRRTFRIYPLSLVCVVAVVAFHVPHVAWRSAFEAPGLGQLLSNLALTQNLTYSESVLSVLWSLPYELQMYAVLPVVFLCLRSGAAAPKALLLLALGVAFAVLQPEVPGFGRLGVAQFGPCFLAGALAFSLRGTQRPALPPIALPLALGALVAGYMAIAWALGVVHPRWLGWTFCIAIGALLPFVRELRSPRVRAICHTIAKYSYGVYLFHMIVLWVAFNRMQTQPEWAQWGAFLVGIALVPVAGYHLVEHPGIVRGGRVADRIGGWRWNGQRAAGAEAAPGDRS